MNSQISERSPGARPRFVKPMCQRRRADPTGSLLTLLFMDTTAFVFSHRGFLYLSSIYIYFKNQIRYLNYQTIGFLFVLNIRRKISK